jgi:hypothetical protein
MARQLIDGAPAESRRLHVFQRGTALAWRGRGKRGGMTATRLLAGLCVVVPLQGCVTDKLWNDWRQPDLHGESMHMPPYRAFPMDVVEAVRTGDGSHHLLMRMSDGQDHRYVIDGVAAAPQGDSAAIGSLGWPGTTDHASVPTPRQVNAGALPRGLPLTVANPRAAEPWSPDRHPHTPDTAMATMIDAPPEPSGDPVIGLDQRKVVLTDDEGNTTVLAEFTPPPRPAPAPRPVVRTRTSRVAETGARIVLTPFALATDAVLGVGMVAGCTLLAPFLFFTLPMLFR